MGILTFAQGCVNLLVTFSQACRDVTYHVLDFGGDIVNLATVVFSISNKIGLLLLNLLKYGLLWVYKIVYVVVYTGWMVMTESLNLLYWICCKLFTYGTTSASFILSQFSQMIGAICSYLFGTDSLVSSYFYNLGAAISSFLTSLTELLFSTVSAVSSNTCTSLSSLWIGFSHVFLSAWVFMCSMKDRCQGMISQICSSLTAPFHIEALRIHVAEVTQDLSQILSSDWYKVAFFCFISSILVCISGRRLCAYLHRKGFTFPLLHGYEHRNVIVLPADNRLDYIDLSDDEEPPFLRRLQDANPEFAAFEEILEVSDTDNSENSDDDIGSEYSVISDESDVTVTESESNDDSEETDEFEDDASDITENEYVDADHIEIQLPESSNRYELRSRGPTPSRLSPFQLKRELENELDKRKCVICTEHDKDVLLLPCRHMCLCVACAHQLVNQRNAARKVCPLCRQPIQSVMNIYL